MKKHVIWSSEFDMNDWLDFINEEYPDTSEEDRYELVCELNDLDLDDRRDDLDIQLSEEIVVLGDIGTWRGARHGRKVIETGNIKDCLYSDTDGATWYFDRYNVRCDAYHHDGTNHYLYRVFRSGLSDEQKEYFLSGVYHDGKWDDRMIRRYTESIRPHVAKVYGW